METEEAKSRWGNIYDLLKLDIAARTSDEAIAEKVLPIGVILGYGAIGAYFGGSVGFGAGSLVGKLLLGEKSAGTVADKIEEAWEDSGPEGPANTD